MLTIEAIAAMLEQLGCPPAHCASMAAQLDKRARQLAQREGRTYDAAMAHLLGLMKQGWAARERGL
jgi:adenine/guanine phosphoribosyltransferase-like PRPP-binding protein